MASMSSRILAPALLVASGLFSLPACAAAEVGDRAPDIQLPGVTNEVRLAALQGKVVYLDFWASWCGPCRKSFPWMNEMQVRYGGRGLQVVAVNLDVRRELADKFLTEVPASFTVAFDARGDSARRYAVKGMPSSVLIGPDGTIVMRHVGFRDDERKDIESAIVAALAKTGK